MTASHRFTRTTVLYLDIKIDHEAAGWSEGVVTLNGHEVWRDEYPPLTAHETVAGDFVEALAAAVNMARKRPL